MLGSSTTPPGAPETVDDPISGRHLMVHTRKTAHANANYSLDGLQRLQQTACDSSMALAACCSSTLFKRVVYICTLALAARVVELVPAASGQPVQTISW
jgi:hypothetical protein